MAKSQDHKITQSTDGIQATQAEEGFAPDSASDANLTTKRPNKGASSSICFWINVCNLGLFFWTLRIVGKAMPEQETFFTRFFSLNVRTRWNMAFLDIATTWLLVIAALSLLNMAFGYFRNGKRYRANESAALVMAGIAIAIDIWLMRV